MKNKFWIVIAFIIAAGVSSVVWMVLCILFSLAASLTDLLVLSIALIFMTILSQALDMKFFQPKPSTTKFENVQTLMEGAVVLAVMAMLFGGLVLVGFDGSSPEALKKIMLFSVAYGLGSWTVFNVKKIQDQMIQVTLIQPKPNLWSHHINLAFIKSLP